MSIDREESYIIFYEDFIAHFSKFSTDKVFNLSFVYVTNSFFCDCSIQGNGGAIRYDKADGDILIEYSTFIKCYTTHNTDKTNYGGGIFVDKCDCVVNCVCGNGCFAQSYTGQFILGLYGSNSNYNLMLSSSVCLTPHKGNSICSVDLLSGKQYCTSTNISRNSVGRCPGIWFNYGTETCFVSYCSLNSNEATIEYGCLCFGHITGKNYYVSQCNVINNTQPESKTEGIISAWKQTTIYSCCILGNTDSHLFYANAEITIINCTLPETFTATNNVIVSEETSTSFINYLTFTFKDELCQTGIESFESLTPIYKYDDITATHKRNLAKKQNISHHNSVSVPPNTNNENEKNEAINEKITRIQYLRKEDSNITNNTETKIMKEEIFNPKFMNILRFITSPILFSIIVLFSSEQR